MLRRRSIRLRIVILVLVPVLALVGLYAVVLNLTLGSYLILKQATSVQTEITRPVSALQAELTVERGLALQYMADPGQGPLSPLLLQERRTDAVVRLFQAAASSAAVTGGASTAELHAIRGWRADLTGLSRLRDSVIQPGFSAINVLHAYSSIISNGDTITNQAILPLVTGAVGIQANDIINIEVSAQAIAEESDLVRSDLTARSFPTADLQLFSQLVVLHREIFNQTLPALDPAYQRYFRTLIPATVSAALVALENDIVTNGAPRDMQATLRSWTSTAGAYSAGIQAALTESGTAIQATAEAQARLIALRLILTGGLGLLAIIAAVAVAIIVSRGLVRQLNDLRLSALDISGQRLPSAIERLRAGHAVDLDAEVPPLEPGANEIGQVRQAFSTVHRTAVAVAIDEAKTRRVVNDVFRNLARRNQSLLSRQLQLLDGMERRVHDPDQLADIFQIDHLTTRMRRHAEGLLIVAGDSSGRIWREPVPFVDVMRAAIAEVEDYTRIRVLSRTTAAVVGHAVADVIHLLAELVENAAIFSPANTPVRIDGDIVANGLAVEIEDRGLGMNQSQMAEINLNLANPPQFDLSGSDQLGLFIAGQLAMRHSIKVTLRESAFGGTTAVVLIPRALVVEAQGLADPPGVGVRELGGRPVRQLPAALSRAGSDTPPGYEGGGESRHYGVATTPDPWDVTQAAEPLGLPVPASATGVWPAPEGAAAGDVAMPASDSSAWSIPGAGTGPWSVPGADADAWSVPGADADAWSAPAAGAPAWAMPGSDPGAAMQPPAQPAVTVPVPVWNDAGASTGGLPSVPEFASDVADPGDLPTRVRQASLAPQLRNRVAPAQPAPSDSASELSPEGARSTMSAWQQGWERGRSLPSIITDEPAAGAGPPSSGVLLDAADPPPAPGQPEPDGQPEGNRQ